MVSTVIGLDAATLGIIENEYIQGLLILRHLEIVNFFLQGKVPIN